MNHPEVRVTVGNMSAKIDKEIASLIKLMWRCMIITAESCQEIMPGKAWLCFPNEYEFKKFLNFVGRGSDVGSLYRRMNPPHGYDDDIPPWQYSIIVEDHSNDDEGCDFQIVVSLFFPISDIPFIIDRLRKISPSEPRQQS